MKDQPRPVKQQKTAILTQIQLLEAILAWAVASKLITTEESTRAVVTLHAGGGARIKVKP